MVAKGQGRAAVEVPCNLSILTQPARKKREGEVEGEEQVEEGGGGKGGR